MIIVQLTKQPDAPAQAKSAGFNTLEFYDDFRSLNTIDIGNTLDSGFKWYTRNAWPNNASVDSAAHTMWANFQATPTGVLTVEDKVGDSDNSTLICGSYEGTKDPGFCASAAATAGGGFVGNVFGPGGYFECRMNFYVTPIYAGNAFWMDPIEFLTGSASKYVEIDTMESKNSPHAQSGVIQVDRSNDPQSTIQKFTNIVDIVDGNFHTYGVLWLTKAMNGGTGRLDYYLDDVFTHSITYTAPEFTTAAGQCSSLLDEMRYVLFLKGVGSGIDWVKVWS